MQIAKIN